MQAGTGQLGAKRCDCWMFFVWNTFWNQKNRWSFWVDLDDDLFLMFFWYFVLDVLTWQFKIVDEILDAKMKRVWWSEICPAGRRVPLEFAGYRSRITAALHLHGGRTSLDLSAGPKIGHKPHQSFGFCIKHQNCFWIFGSNKSLGILKILLVSNAFFPQLVPIPQPKNFSASQRCAWCCNGCGSSAEWSRGTWRFAWRVSFTNQRCDVAILRVEEMFCHIFFFQILDGHKLLMTGKWKSSKEMRVKNAKVRQATCGFLFWVLKSPFSILYFFGFESISWYWNVKSTPRPNNFLAFCWGKRLEFAMLRSVHRGRSTKKWSKSSSLPWPGTTH